MYIIIIGCGKIGAYLAKLLDKDHNVVVIDKEEKSFDKLGDFNGSIFIGDGLDIDVLKEAGIEKADAIAVVTSNDNANIVIGQIAKKKFNISKTIIRISDPEKEEICKYLGIETINTTSIIASLLKDGLSKKVAIKYLIENDDLAIVEIESEIYTNKKINEIKREELIPITVIRNNRSILPDDNLIIEKGDIIIGITRKNLLNKMKGILKL
ncbi:MAG: potassium channel family protein [Candidatus Ratteibacteria bacterium]